MVRWAATIVFGLALATASVVGGAGFVDTAEATALQQNDEEVPPGNPVIGDDRPGDVEPQDDTSYTLWIVLAVCLIGAGTLLVKIERWEARRVSG